MHHSRLEIKKKLSRQVDIFSRVIWNTKNQK